MQKGQLYEPIGFGLLTLLAAKQMDFAGDSAVYGGVSNAAAESTVF